MSSSSVIRVIMPGQLPPIIIQYQSIMESRVSLTLSLHLSTCQTIVSSYLSTLSAHSNSPLVSDWLKVICKTKP